VLHNVDLTATPSPELAQLIRDTLLERKVIFFRSQHLDEGQQTAFSKQFGSLDAFPFGTPGENPFIVKLCTVRAAPAQRTVDTPTSPGWSGRHSARSLSMS
jgi:alpha-ketoglutarate-dependent taurine dioxygenase